LVAEAYDELHEHRLSRLVEHGLELAYVKDYVRQSQQRLLVAPLLARLAQGQVDLQPFIQTYLDELRIWPRNKQGYAPANLIALLRLHRGHLNALDFSRLVLRSAYLQGAKMQDASLAGAVIQDSAF